MMQSSEGLGYEDLNSLMKEPKPLSFIIELLSVSKVREWYPTRVENGQSFHTIDV